MGWGCTPGARKTKIPSAFAPSREFVAGPRAGLPRPGKLFRAVPDLDAVFVPIGLGSGISAVIAARDALGLSYLFISHDLAVVAQLSGRIAVMYRGQICEIGAAAEVLQPPYHPYTRMRLASAADDEAAAEPVGGGIAAAGQAGRVFAARCPHKLGSICDTTLPPFRAVSESHAIAGHIDAIPNAAILSAAKNSGLSSKSRAVPEIS